MSRILVVDDRESMRDSVATTLARKGHSIVTAVNGKAALTKLAERSCDAVITDLEMPEMTGLGLLEEIRRIDEQLPVIIMTAYGTVETAISAMKCGAYDYIAKPFTGDTLLLTVERALEHTRLIKENNILKAGSSPNPTRTEKREQTMIGDGAIMTQMRERFAKIADSHGTVLISGESGSGKEVAARWIHEHSPRASAPFLAVNCAALSTSLLESELFGHEKGSFTGADKLRKGRFELADGGTLLLDEISEVAPEIQAKLLRVLQERCFERVGSSVSRSADVRVIATTNRDLPAEVAKGRFREDLYFRLNVLPLQMPPLRRRVEDIPSLAAHFFAEVARREGKTVKQLSDAAAALMVSYNWPGNVRELQNICERAAVLAPDDEITHTLIASWLGASPADHVQPRLNGAAHASNGLPASMIELNGVAGAPSAVDLRSIICDEKLTLEQIEREVIVATIEHNRGHRQRSATALGIGVRTLGLKLKKWKEQQLVAPTL